MVQGTMRGKDFARTLISGVDTGRADEYLDRVDILDEKLANMQVCWHVVLFMMHEAGCCNTCPLLSSVWQCQALDKAILTCDVVAFANVSIRQSTQWRRCSASRSIVASSLCIALLGQRCFLCLCVQVPLTEFENFAALRRDVHTLGVALEFYHNTVGHLKAEDFQRAARKITGQAMDKRLIHIVFAVFDTDQNGDLSHKELLEVLRRREGNSTYQTYGMERKESGATGLFKCLVNCVAGQSGPG